MGSNMHESLLQHPSIYKLHVGYLYVYTCITSMCYVYVYHMHYTVHTCICYV
jgi:hypothetical protein